MVAGLRTSIACALIAGPAVLALELIRRADMLAQTFTWLDDAIGAALLVAAALFALRTGRAGPLALAWAFGAGQMLMSLLGQLGHEGADPSGQPLWIVAGIKAGLLAGAVLLAFATLASVRKGR